jgi:hypothetical protein
LRFVQPGLSESPLIATSDYDLEGDADASIPPVSLGELMDWLRGRLDEGTDESVSLADDVVERMLQSSMLARGRRRVMLLAGKVQSRFDLSGWRLSELSWPTDNVGEVVARGPRGACVALRFSLGIRDNRSQVGVDFRVFEGSDHATVKPVVDRMVSLLRETRSQVADATAAV